MDPACGPPDAMADDPEELTPMMAQYYGLCRRYDDALVLFQVGDFYEAFCEAAERCARLLEIALTSREDSTGEYPMAGIPIDNAESYIETLLEAGYRVAVADQVEEPGESPGVVERAVTRVVTPGTLTEDELLAGSDNNFVASLAGSGDDLAVAFLDVSTGDFLTTSSGSREAIGDEISRFAPAEAVVGPDLSSDLLPDDRDCMVTPYDRRAFDRERAGGLVGRYFGDPDRVLGNDAEIRACGALLSYAEYARGGADGADGGDDAGADDASGDSTEEGTEERDGRLEYITHVTRYDPREYLLLDAVALRSLELFEPRAVHGREDATLVGVIDETASALGGRKLRDWLRRPLLSPDRIGARLDAVEELSTDVRTRESLHEELTAIYDLERLIGRISRGRADARDLQSLRTTLEAVPGIRESLADADCERLRELHADLDPLADVRELIGSAIVAEPPVEITEGGVIAEDYDEDLDDLRATAREGKAWIEDLAERERERTGIESLKVDHSSVHGYYIEVTNPNLDRVPEDYERRQTLKNAERFVTPELRDREDEIVRAEGRADDREYELFREVRGEVASEVERVQALAEALATVDALVSLSTVAAQYDYCRPEVIEGGTEIEIEGGRHPVVERTQESFVPNGARLDPDRRLAVITGPNMSGKSTYMRQVACIAVLAQMGSFVPARSVRLAPLERVFTRVGASDDIAGGRSTFMVEMEELATILREADGRSLVLLDEVGRGTSTADGLAIARAIAERLHAEEVLTLFATHHHPLTELAAELEGARRLHFEADEEGGEVVFSHEIEPGAAEGSYGIEVAAAAGVPGDVVDRSRELVAEATRRAGEGVEPDEQPADGSVTTTATADGGERPAGSRSSPDSSGGGERTHGSRSPSEHRSDVGDVPDDVAAELRALDLAHLTPVEALTELDRLKRLLEGESAPTT